MALNTSSKINVVGKEIPANICNMVLFLLAERAINSESPMLYHIPRVNIASQASTI